MKNVPEQPVRVLFVCMGNICRSPTAEAVFRARVNEAGLSERFEIDSAGTHAYHIGKSPDQRARAVAERRGVSMEGQHARRVTPEDFSAFDYIIAMDDDNLEELKRVQREADEAGEGAVLSLLLEYDTNAGRREVPDPYYGGAQGFEQVFDLVDGAAQYLLETLRD